MARLRRQMAGLPTLKPLEPLHRRKLPVLQELSENLSCKNFRSIACCARVIH